MGVQLSWESTCLASRGSAVRSRSSPPNNVKCVLIQKHSSAGQSTTLIRWGSVVRVHLLLPKVSFIGMRLFSYSNYLREPPPQLYSTVGVCDNAIVLHQSLGVGANAPRASPLASTKKYQVEWLGIFYLVDISPYTNEVSISIFSWQYRVHLLLPRNTKSNGLVFFIGWIYYLTRTE